ncbi:MAG: hypothetical protein EXR75_13605 [Myxococcales bacterium]|nr:hypothetical protein [Myxococcales bacterium]
MLTTLLALVLLLALAPSAYASACPDPKPNPSPADVNAARDHMKAGSAFAKDPDGAQYEEAYPEFRKAYVLSGSLNALQNLGTCAMKLELDGEAIGCFQRFLEKKGATIDAADQAQVDADLAALASSVAWVTFSSDRPVVKLVDVRTTRSGKTIRNMYQIGIVTQSFGLHPGSHDLVASVNGLPEQKWTIEISNGSKHNKEFVFDPGLAPTPLGPDTPDPVKDPTAEPTKDPVKTPTGTDKPPPPTGEPKDAAEGSTRPVPMYVWIAGGASLAVGAGAGAFGAMALSQKSDYDTNILGKASLAEQEATREKVASKGLITDVLAGAAIAGGVTTLVLFLTRPEVPAKTSGARRTPASVTHDDAALAGFGRDWTLAPAFDEHGGSVSLFATF